MRTFILFSILSILFVFVSCTKSGDSTDSAGDSAGATKVDASTPRFPVKGKISYGGSEKAGAAIKVNADPACVKELAGKPLPNETLVVGSGGGLANAFVYIRGSFAGVGSGADREPLVLDQHGCRYVPHVWGVQTGQKIKILNSDPTLHNVNAMAKTNAGFNVGMATKGQTVEKSFSRPEMMIKFKCDVHGWMASYGGVLDHPFFAVSGNNGEFAIEGVPQGKHTLVVWHEKLGEKTLELEVGDQASDVSVAFP